MSARIECGACFCGAITAELHDEPFWICHDHDDDCRRAIGAPLTIWVGYRPSQFVLLRGTPASFSKTRGVTRTFCAHCGTSIGYKDEGAPDELYLTIGFFDHPEHFAPVAHAYWKMKLPFMQFADNLAKVDTYSRKRDAGWGNPADR